MALAGLGSRFAAYLLDLLIEVAILAVGSVVLTVAADGTASTGTRYVYAGLLAAVAFVDYFGYFVLCEMVSSGRSPGKRAAGIRVIRADGAPIGFKASLLRNICRLIDGFPQPLCLVGSVLILSTRANQRLGDLLAGTVVVRERRGEDRAVAGAAWAAPAGWGAPAAWAAPAGWQPQGPQAWPPQAPGRWGPGGAPGRWGPPAEAAHWDVSALGPQDLAVVSTFLQHRAGYTPEARARLSWDLMARVAPMVHGPTRPMDPEHFLELVVLVKTARG